MNYLILPSNSIGGSEIRFINNWIYSKQIGLESNVKMVVTENLLSALAKRQQLYDELMAYREDIVVTSFPDKFTCIQNKLKALVETELPNVKIAMTLLQIPLKVKKKKGQRFIYIFPGSSFFSDTNFKGSLGQVLNVLKADAVDVLDPIVYRLLRKIFFFKRKAFYLTRFGIGHHSPELISRIDYNRKLSQLAFVGRFVEVKQVVEFLNCVEHVWNVLQTAGIFNARFIVVGQGPLENEVRRRVMDLKEKGVMIERTTSDNPFDILFESKIYFSLQKNNNYPSQSLIEAMLCGCIPIVTNCGSSEKLIKPELRFMVHEKLDAEQLARHCVHILSLNSEEFESSSRQMIDYLTSQFSGRKMAEYYHSFFAS